MQDKQKEQKKTNPDGTVSLNETSAILAEIKELKSTNEELNTKNEELNNRNEELQTEIALYRRQLGLKPIQEPVQRGDREGEEDEVSGDLCSIKPRLLMQPPHLLTGSAKVVPVHTAP